MGTNYYHHDIICPTCQHAAVVTHIGKSSGGWCFSLHVYPEDGINDLADWEARWTAGEIRDEYGGVILPAAMRNTVTDRSWATRCQLPPEWYGQNYAEPGPKNLARHKIGHGCVGHGEGTWDLIVGEFS